MSVFKDFDLENYIIRFGAKPLKKRYEWIMDCPLCGKEKLTVNVQKKLWHCWVCQEFQMNEDGKRVPVKGAGGLVALIQWLEGCSREHAIAVVVKSVDFYSVNVEYLEEFEENVVLKPKVKSFLPRDPPEFWKSIDGILPYMSQRGILMDDVRSFGLFYCDSGRYANRLVFPVWEDGKLVYWQARAMWEGVGKTFRKVLNPPSQEGYAGAGDVLMNLNTARFYPRVAIVEGPIDCVHVGPSAVCSFGKKLSFTQIIKLKNAGVRAIDFLWDGPSETEPNGAQFEMLRYSSMINGLFDVRLIFLPYGDPGNYNRVDLDSFRTRGMPASSLSRLAQL